MPSLFVIQGRDQGTRFELDLESEGEKATAGRVGTNTVQLHDTEVSRQHAEVVREGDDFVLADLNSSNGTYVNGKPIKKHALKTGDQIQMGRSLMLFTGKMGDSSVADSQVDIIASRGDADGSRILHSMSQAEGSELLATPADQTQSPWLARARSNLQIMYRTALAVSHTLDIDQLLSRIMDMIFEWVEADRGCIMLKNEQTGKLEARVRRHRRGPRSTSSSNQPNGNEDGDRIAISQTILDYVMDRREGVLTSNARDDERWNPAQSIVRMGVREAICVPMQGRYDLVGVIYIDTSITPKQMLEKGVANQFGQEHLKLMIAIAHQAALAVEDTSYYQAMVQAERLAAVGQTIATLSHHIKNILQGVRGGSYLVEMGMKEHAKAMGNSPPPADAGSDATVETVENLAEQLVDAEAAIKAVATMRKGWNIVEKNQERISGLVMDMLTYSKEREPEPTEAELNEVVADVVELMQTRASDAGVELLWQPSDKLPTMRFDPEALHRAILNVVTNAIDACETVIAASSEADEQDGFAREAPRAATVTISTAYDEGRKRASVIVQDTGEGIAKDELERIFTVFVSNKGGRGTGLGLPVTQKILQEHGGVVLVSSEPGKGSRFTLELPLAAPERVNDSDADPGTVDEPSPHSQTLVNPTAE
ncbi:MAG: ATP-binding protein [Planctomycetota bacterium]